MEGELAFFNYRQIDCFYNSNNQSLLFFYCFGGADGAAAAGAELFPGDVPVLPLLIYAAVADCDFHLRTSSQVSVK